MEDAVLAGQDRAWSLSWQGRAEPDRSWDVQRLGVAEHGRDRPWVGQSVDRAKPLPCISRPERSCSEQGILSAEPGPGTVRVCHRLAIAELTLDRSEQSWAGQRRTLIGESTDLVVLQERGREEQSLGRPEQSLGLAET